MNNAGRNLNWTGALDAEQIYRLDGMARERFTYEGDGAFDTWRSHAKEALSNRPWRGDCDDLATTALDLMGRAGLPLERRFMIAVDAERSGGIDHLVACAIDDKGRFWIVGDTAGPAYGARGMPHRAVKYHRLDEIGEDRKRVWREGAPWA